MSHTEKLGLVKSAIFKNPLNLLEKGILGLGAGVMFGVPTYGLFTGAFRKNEGVKPRIAMPSSPPRKNIASTRSYGPGYGQEIYDEIKNIASKPLTPTVATTTREVSQ